MPSSFDAAPALPSWLTREFPYRRRIGRVVGKQLHFVDEGDGPAVLLVHGNPTWSFLWRKVIQRLRAAGVRVVAPDLVGLGLSEKPHEVAAHTLENHVGWIGGLVDALGLDRFTVVGQDWGGPIGAAVAARRSARVHGLVLANTAVLAPRRPLQPTSFHKLSHVPLVSDLLFRSLGFPLGDLGRAQGDPHSIGAYERMAYFYPLARAADRAAPLGLARMVPDEEHHASLAVLDETDRWIRSFTGPAALVWGVRDPILGRALGRLREALPKASVTQTQAGHFLQEEVPDELASAILGVVRA